MQQITSHQSQLYVIHRRIAKGSLLYRHSNNCTIKTILRSVCHGLPMIFPKKSEKFSSYSRKYKFIYGHLWIWLYHYWHLLYQIPYRKWGKYVNVTNPGGSCNTEDPSKSQEMVWWFAQIHDDVIKWKHFPRYWIFVRGIHRSPVNSPHKGQWRGALMFSLTRALNIRLSKQLWDWWFLTPSRSLWSHCNVMAVSLPCSVKNVKTIRLIRHKL